MFADIVAGVNPEFNKNNVEIFKLMLEQVAKFPPCPTCEIIEDCSIKACAID